MVTSRSLRDWRELNIEMDAHCFHKVPCGSNVRVDELGGDDATSGVADTVWWDFDGQELEGQGPDTPREACVFTSVLPFSIQVSATRALRRLTSNTIRRGVERLDRECGDLVVRHCGSYCSRQPESSSVLGEETTRGGPRGRGREQVQDDGDVVRRENGRGGAAGAPLQGRRSSCP